MGALIRSGRAPRSRPRTARRSVCAEASTSPPDICPYPGLAAFGPDQAQWFFGRERASAELLDLVADAAVPVMVCGPSGTGKSSLLRAGLLPALQAGRLPGSAGWTRVVLTPTADPVGRLNAVLPMDADAVLVVDQFEEVFTLCHDESRRQEFIEALCGSPARVVLGMRADFLGRCASHPGLVEALRHGHLTDLRDGRLHVDDRIIPLAAPVRLRLTAYLTCRQQSWPNTANPHLFIHYRNASTTRPVTPWWIRKRLGMSAQSIRQDRILDEAHASSGDVRLICDLFGLSVAGAYRYAATVDHPGVRRHQIHER